MKANVREDCEWRRKIIWLMDIVFTLVLNYANFMREKKILLIVNITIAFKKILANYRILFLYAFVYFNVKNFIHSKGIT